MTERYIEWLLETEADEKVIREAMQEYRRERCNLLILISETSKEN